MQVDGAVRLLHGERVGFRVAGEIECDHRHVIAVAQVGQLQAQAVHVAGGGTILRMPHRRGGSQQARTGDLRPEPVHDQLRLRLEQVQEQVPGPGGHAHPVVLVGKRATLRSVDRLAVHLQPGADGAQPLGAWLRDHPLRRGADVEQVVHPLARQVDQQQQQVLHRLPVVVVALEAPGVVQRGGGLVVRLHPAGGNLVIAQAAVVAHVVADAPAHQAIRLQPVHEVAQLDAVLAADGVGGVEPDQPHRAVPGEQLAQLRLYLALQVGGEVLLLRSEVPVVAGAARIVPILVLGIVEAEPDAGIAAGIRQLGQRIAPVRGGVHDVVRAARRAIQGEAVVVLGGDHQVAHARLHGEIHPRLRIEPYRVELLRQGLVFRARNALAEHDPLADAIHRLTLPDAGRNGVQAPMNEHAEARLAPPAQARVMYHRGGVAAAHARPPSRELCHGAQGSRCLPPRSTTFAVAL